MSGRTIVIGAGHNGLVAAAYLARAGVDVTVLEARDAVGGCASTVRPAELGGAAGVNICNCDHLLVRTTGIAEELGLADHGLRYLDVDPAQLQLTLHTGEPAWPVFHDVDRTVDALRALHPGEADGYRRYVEAARPVVDLIVEMAMAPPTVKHAARRVLERRGRGVATLLRWSRRSCVDVLRDFFTSDAVIGPQATTGPAVWGLSPAQPGTGLGALGYAMKHVGQVGRPEGGSGSLPTAVAAAVVAAGGTIRTGAVVTAIGCERDRVHHVELAGGERLDADQVVVACDPHVAFVRWLRDPLPGWVDAPTHDGYESKVDAVIDVLPRYRAVDAARLAELGVDDPLVPTAIISPPVDAIDAAHRDSRRVAARPMFYANVPSVLDPTMAPVLSLEVLYTPYDLEGGWSGSAEPDRWLEAYSTLLEPGFLDGVQGRRAMTPPEYERQFHLPRGHATSFPGGPVAALLGRQPELSRYRTPVAGLYVTGAATFPGAGVWGASGRNCARTVLRHGATG